MIGRAGIIILKIWNKYLQEAGTDNEFIVINSALSKNLFVKCLLFEDVIASFSSQKARKEV
jgi:hypothetical protein